MAKPLSASIKTFKTSSEIAGEDVKTAKKLKVKAPSKKTLTWAILIILVAFSALMYAEYLSAKHKLSSQSSINQQVKNTINQVGKLAVVPKNETPTVVTVNDAAKLKGQSFFANAINGDKVIVYSKADEAVLYRPSTNQIVNIAPVSVSNQH